MKQPVLRSARESDDRESAQPVRAAQSHVSNQPACHGDPQAQPSEPILFPRLRIYFADFPYLHCSIDQRLHTLET